MAGRHQSEQVADFSPGWLADFSLGWLAEIVGIHNAPVIEYEELDAAKRAHQAPITLCQRSTVS